MIVFTIDRIYKWSWSFQGLLGWAELELELEDRISCVGSELVVKRAQGDVRGAGQQPRATKPAHG